MIFTQKKWLCQNVCAADFHEATLAQFSVQSIRSETMVPSSLRGQIMGAAKGIREHDLRITEDH